MFNFHSDTDHYFNMQKWVTKEYVMPYLSQIVDFTKPLKVLEVGCGEAGVLAAFIEGGHHGTGIELSTQRAKVASQNLAVAIDQGQCEIINEDIYNIDYTDPKMKFDLIVLKDVIEHIPHQEKFIPTLKHFLNGDGIIFFGYPPWWMPFGGHQQICKNRFLSILPWYHLLPKPIYKSILKLFKEPKSVIDELMSIKYTGITIERMYSILSKNHFSIIKEDLWFINPIYVKKFGLNPIKQKLNIPYIRNFISTAHYIIFKNS